MAHELILEGLVWFFFHFLLDVYLILVFSRWFGFFCLNGLSCCREQDKKVCCLGLTSLIALPADQLPGEALGRVFRATLDLLVAYKDQVAGLFFTLFLYLYL